MEISGEDTPGRRSSQAPAARNVWRSRRRRLTKVIDSWLRTSNLRVAENLEQHALIMPVLGPLGCRRSGQLKAQHWLRPRALLRRPSGPGVPRDVLPLPALHSLPDVLPTTAVEPAQLCDFCELDRCWDKFPARKFQDRLPDTFGSPPSAVQASAHRHVLSRVARFLDRFNAAMPGTWAPSDGIAYFQHGRPARYVDLRAEQPRLPRVIPETCLLMVSLHSCPTQDLLFLKVLITLREPLAQRGEIERNTCLPTARQLVAGTLRLHCKIHSCADMFAMEKGQTTENEPFGMGPPSLSP